MDATKARTIGLQQMTENLDQRQMTMAIFGSTNLNNAQIATRADAGKLGGGISQAASDVEKILSEHLLGLPPSEKGNWIRQIVTGEKTQAQLEQYAQRTALTQMPWLKDFIDQGLSPAQGLAPYKQTFARVLEMNPNEVNFQDPKFQSTLRMNDGNGPARLATTTELAANIRTNFADQWEKTSGAKQTATQLTGRIAQMFGQRD